MQYVVASSLMSIQSANGSGGKNGLLKNERSISSVRARAVKILGRMESTGSYLDRLLESEIKSSDLSVPDKALLYEILNGTLRWKLRIDYVISLFYKGKYSSCSPDIKNSMRSAVYQILWLSRIPDYAAVNEAVNIVKALESQRAASMVNAVLRNILRNKDSIEFPVKDRIKYLSIFYSHPEWLVKRWLGIFGEEFTVGLMEANNRKPNICLRANSIKIKLSDFEKELDASGFVSTPGKFLKEFVEIEKPGNIADSPMFKNGCFSIQDEATGLSVKLFGARPGSRVLDLCSAPGGKTSIIAQDMNDSGCIIALDKFESRIKTLESNIQRLGITCVRPVVQDGLTYQDPDGFDSVFLDAPCSGSGTIAKKPDQKWSRSPQDLKKLTELQYSLLCKGASLLKPGGHIVYSTCSIDPAENYSNIKRFLSENPGFCLQRPDQSFDSSLVTPEGCIQSYPNLHFIDGAFAAKLKKI